MSSLAGPKEERRQEAVRIASEMFRSGPSWSDFFREILGVEGVVRQLFPRADEMKEFQQSDEHRKIQRMLKVLMEEEKPNAERQPTRVITVRLPAAVHDALKEEAKLVNTSINRLCITKLLRVAEDDENEQGPPEDSF